VPSPNAIGLDVTLGLSQVTADASGFQPIKPIGGTTSPPASSPPVPGGGGGGTQIGSTSGSISTGGGLPGGSQIGGGAQPGSQPIVAAQAASSSVLGIPIRVLWVVASLLLAFMAAGMLLAYANWQLLRGRTS
jgi:hypothetical protein